MTASNWQNILQAKVKMLLFIDNCTDRNTIPLMENVKVIFNSQLDFCGLTDVSTNHQEF